MLATLRFTTLAGLSAACTGGSLLDKPDDPADDDVETDIAGETDAPLDTDAHFVTCGLMTRGPIDAKVATPVALEVRAVSGGFFDAVTPTTEFAFRRIDPATPLPAAEWDSTAWAWAPLTLVKTEIFARYTADVRIDTVGAFALVLRADLEGVSFHPVICGIPNRTPDDGTPPLDTPQPGFDGRWMLWVNVTE